MSKITLQFHADRQELLAVFDQIRRELGLTAAVEYFRPVYRVYLVGGLESLLSVAGAVDRVSLHRGPVVLDSLSSLDFLRKNPGSLTIRLGEQTGELLRESFLGAATDDPELLACWKRVRNFLRRSMLKGAWVENLTTGARMRKDAHLFTAGARDLMISGVQIMGPTDVVAYFLDQLSRDCRASLKWWLMAKQG